MKKFAKELQLSRMLILMILLLQWEDRRILMKKLLREKLSQVNKILAADIPILRKERERGYIVIAAISLSAAYAAVLPIISTLIRPLSEFFLPSSLSGALG